MPEANIARKVPVQVKLSVDLVKEIDHLSVEWGMYRVEAMERLLREAIEPYRRQGVLWSVKT